MRVYLTKPAGAFARAADLAIEHVVTCYSVPVQVEGVMTHHGRDCTRYYFRFRHGRWSLSIDVRGESLGVEIASGRIGNNLDGDMPHEVAFALIDAALVAWHTAECHQLMTAGARS